MVVDEEAALLHPNVDEETVLLLHPNVDEEAAHLLHPNSHRPTSLLRILENPCLPCAVIVFVIAATILAYQIKVIL